MTTLKTLPIAGRSDWSSATSTGTLVFVARLQRQRPITVIAPPSYFLWPPPTIVVTFRLQLIGLLSCQADPSDHIGTSQWLTSTSAGPPLYTRNHNAGITPYLVVSACCVSKGMKTLQDHSFALDCISPLESLNAWNGPYRQVFVSSVDYLDRKTGLSTSSA